MIESKSIKDVKLETGNTIKALRKQRKLSQQDLADQLDLSRLTIQSLESGKNCTIDTLLKVIFHFDLLDNLHAEIIQFQENIDPSKSLY